MSQTQGEVVGTSDLTGFWSEAWGTAWICDWRLKGPGQRAVL